MDISVKNESTILSIERKDNMNFIHALENELNRSVTENGALGLKTTGKALLDMNFKVTSYRNKSEDEIVADFEKSFNEDALLALKWLFYCRDIREGLGERRTFRVIMHYLADEYPEVVERVLKLIPEYGRWDDLVDILSFDNTELDKTIVNIIHSQLIEDIENMKNEGPITLLAKWLPSSKASSKATRAKASILYHYLGMDGQEYRKLLSKLRSYLKIVEKDMSNGKWTEIKYSAVPSKAMLKYNNAFIRHDEEGFSKYLEDVKSGKKTINSSVTYPYEIVHSYYMKGYVRVDETLEELWKALPKKSFSGSTIVVADGSGSMTSLIGGTKVTALDVANALAIYCAEQLEGEFKDKYITFSNRPQFVDLSTCKSLSSKILQALRHKEVADTNIEATFDLLLNTAVKYNMNQKEIPSNILIISDMEFNQATYRYNINDTLFDTIRYKWEEAGYKLPRLIFWNVCNRTNTIPVCENEMGVALVSGFSQNILDMIMSDELDPYKLLVNVLNSNRYKPIELALE